MTTRITRKDLDRACNRLNTLTGAPSDSYTRNAETGKLTANIDNYHISSAYGGYALNKMANESGGVHDVLRMGHIPARELYNLIHAYIGGIESTIYK